MGATPPPRGGGGGGGGGSGVVISSWTGGVVGVEVCVARVSVSVLVTSRDTETTRAMAAMMAVTPTTQGQRGGASSPTTSVAAS